jgi:hypothetical protein
MERLSWQEKFSRQFICPPGLDEAEVELFVRPINFIADNRMTEMGEMDPELVRSSRLGNCPNDCESSWLTGWPNESLFDSKIAPGRRPLGVDRLLEPDGRVLVCALARERCIDPRLLPFRPAVHDREILLRDFTPFHGATEAPRRGGIFRDQDETARLAIEPVDDRDLTAVNQLVGEQLAQRGPERRGAIGLARMNEKKGRFVDQKVIVRLGYDAKSGRHPCVLRGRG